MRRLWFKKEMKERILASKKKATSRYKMLVGQYQAVSGSRFKAQVFATLSIWKATSMTWRSVIANHYAEEGFASSEEMQSYLEKEKLIRNSLDDEVWYHEFVIWDSSKPEGVG